VHSKSLKADKVSAALHRRSHYGSVIAWRRGKMNSALRRHAPKKTSAPPINYLCTPTLINILAKLGKHRAKQNNN